MQGARKNSAPGHYVSQTLCVKIKKCYQTIEEKLINPLEANYTLELRDMYVIPPVIENPSLTTQEINKKINYYIKLGAKLVLKGKSGRRQILKKEKIKQLLKKIAII